MQHLKKLIVRVIAGTFALAPAVSLSCTCADQGPDSEDAVIEALCAVDAVFVGRVVAQRAKPDSGMVIEIEPKQIFKGAVTRPAVTEGNTTCDHWFSPDTDYLIFGSIEEDTDEISTSICGPSRFTRPLKGSDFQYRILKENIDQIDELCREPESTERRLRMLKERRNPTDINYDQLLEETQAIQDENK